MITNYYMAVAAKTNTPETPVVTRAAKRHGSYYRGCPVAACGKVNLSNGRNAMFGTIWDCWMENNGTNFLCKSFEGKFYIVHTSGTMNNVLVGDSICLQHDQSGRKMGEWQIIAKAPHNAAGLLEFKKVCNKSSVHIATFK